MKPLTPEQKADCRATAHAAATMLKGRSVDQLKVMVAALLEGQVEATQAATARVESACTTGG